MEYKMKQNATRFLVCCLVAGGLLFPSAALFAQEETAGEAVENSELTEINLSKSILTKANLNGCFLKNAVLRDADLHLCSFVHSVLVHLSTTPPRDRLLGRHEKGSTITRFVLTVLCLYVLPTQEY